MFGNSVALTMNCAWIIFCGCTKGNNENIKPLCVSCEKSWYC